VETLDATTAPVNGAAPHAPQPEPAAVARPPGADGTVRGSTSTAKGAAPLTLDELRAIPEAQRTRAQKRRLTTLDNERRLAERRAARAAKKAEPAPTAAGAEQSDEDRDDEQRKHETGGFWRLTLRVVGLVLWPFGYKLDDLTEKECAQDVALLLPLVKRHRWLDVLIRYAAVPYLLVERVVLKVRRREEEKPATTDAKPPPRKAAA
jgi:hypothetical protein